MEDGVEAEHLANTVMELAEAGSPAHGEAQELPQATGRARYHAGRLIGRGGMGQVLEAEDRQFGRKVALKTMLDSVASDPDRAQRFGIEAIVTANLDHPGIPAVYERGLDGGGQPFYAMRLVRGRSLEQAIARTRTLDDRLRLLPALIDVAQTIAFAHARGVIHRDIKPDNVVVGAYGDTVVIDWGVAKLRGVSTVRRGGERSPAQVVADTGGSTATRDGTVVGTPAYMAPEQAAGLVEAVDERSDVFSLGALLYYLFAGHPPYRGRNPFQILNRAIAGEFQPLAEVAPETPASLRAIVQRAMAKQPGERYASAGALALALQEVVAAGVRDRSSKAVRLFANATSVVLTLVMLALVVMILANVPFADLGALVFVLLPSFALGTVLAGIEWWTAGRHQLSPLVLGLAVVTVLEGVVGAALGRLEIAEALTYIEAPEATELALAYMKGTRIVNVVEAVGLQLGAALLVFYVIARYRIGVVKARAT